MHSFFPGGSICIHLRKEALAEVQRVCGIHLGTEGLWRRKKCRPRVEFRLVPRSAHILVGNSDFHLWAIVCNRVVMVSVIQIISCSVVADVHMIPKVTHELL